MAQRRIKLFFDGGCRPNPGPIEVCVVLRGQVHRFGDLGTGTNLDAEWLALIRAAELARAECLGHVVLLGDALHVIRAARAALAGKRLPHAHAAEFLAAAAGLGSLHLRWVRRGQNLAGIALAATHPR